LVLVSGCSQGTTSPTTTVASPTTTVASPTTTSTSTTTTTTTTLPPYTEDEYAVAYARMRVEDDKVEGTKWIVAKSSAKYLNSGNDVQLYINARGISSILRFKVQYAGNDWIFIEEYFFNVDGETFSIPVEYGDVERDNGYGGVWEWYDEAPVPPSRLSMIDKIISSQSAVLRFKGDRTKDIEITKAQKRALSDVLTVYDGLQRGKYSSS